MEKKNKNNVQEIKEKYMLQHLQLIKPKKFYKIDYCLQNCKIKHDTTKT